MRPAATLAVLIASAGLADAQLFVATTQSRFVAAEVEVTGPGGFTANDADSDQAVDFTPFAASVSAELTGLGATGSAFATIDSEILSDSITASGTAGGIGTVHSTGFQSIAVSESEVRIEFTLTEEREYHILGLITGGGNGSSSARIYSPGASHFSANAFTNSGSPDNLHPIDQAGVLDPGDYTLRLRSNSLGLDPAHGGITHSSAGYDVVLSFTALVQNYCSAAPNSVGPGATIGMSGLQLITVNYFNVTATGVPPSHAGLFYYGPNQIQTAFGDGFRCVGGPLHRLNPPVFSSAWGFATKQVDFTSGPAASGPGAILSGSTWNFQYWYRDSSGTSARGFNLSDGLQVTFGP